LFHASLGWTLVSVLKSSDLRLDFSIGMCSLIDLTFLSYVLLGLCLAVYTEDRFFVAVFVIFIRVDLILVYYRLE